MDDETALASVLNGCLPISQRSHLVPQLALEIAPGYFTAIYRAELKGHRCATGKIGSRFQAKDRERDYPDNDKYLGDKEKPLLPTNEVHYSAFLTVLTDGTP
jgi:hypothetical protein